MSSKKDTKEVKKVAIVGFAPSWKDAPWEDESYEIWCLNEMYRLAPEVPNGKFRADRWFEIHDLNSPSKSKPEHQEFLKNCPVPLYVQTEYAWLPNALIFPFQKIFSWMAEKGFNGSQYFTNTISYLVMFAAMEGFTEISIYGVNMSSDSEYFHQKASAEYMVGLCEGMGIKVFIPDSSELLKCNQLYAVQSSNKLRLWVREQDTELGKRQKAYQQQEQQAQQALQQAQLAIAELRGARQAYKEWLKRSQ